MRPLLKLSASSIDAFDSDTTWGCNRSWWLKYIAGEKTPPSDSMQLGTYLHELVEADLMGGSLVPPPPDNDFSDPGEPEEEGRVQTALRKQAYGIYTHGAFMVDRIRSRVRNIEASVDAILEGLPLVGYSDVVLHDGILDWKTSSDISRYAKTPAQLARNTQLLLYARFFHPVTPKLYLAHGYFQTKGRRAEIVETHISQQQMRDRVDGYVVDVVKKMKVAAQATSHLELEPQWDKCSRCFFRTRCPKDPTAVSNFFKNLVSKQAAPAPAAAPQAAPAAPPSQTARTIIVPPDAAPANALPPPRPGVPAATAAQAAAAPPPAEQPKRGPGRPPGSKTKPRMLVVGPDSEPAPAVTAPAVGVEPARLQPLGDNPAAQVAQRGATIVQVTEVAIGEKVHINLGNYNSAETWVEMKAQVSGDVKSATAMLLAQVRAQLEEQAKVYEEMAGETPQK